jgi:hypothetical protein
VGGRSFTSQVMQKNCTEFIAYENIVPAQRSGPARAERGAPRARTGAQPIEQAVPLVKRALKVLTDREVTPQLGLLKSTLLQLDSSFSERDYGAGSFREFADKLANQGLVSLKHQGRSTHVELVEDGQPVSAAVVEGEPIEVVASSSGNGHSLAAQPPPAEARPQPAASLGEGVAFVRRVLADPPNPPRWPMYPRQFKQFLRAADPTFDEARYGSIADLMRASQKDGLLRLERDRQGGLRVFASPTAAPSSVPLGWSRGDLPPAGLPVDVEEAPSPVQPSEPAIEAVAEEVAEPAPPPSEEAPAPAKARRTRARKSAAGDKPAERRPRRARKTTA